MKTNEISIAEFCCRLKRKTAHNDHVSALLDVATRYQLNKYIGILINIRNIINAEGYNPISQYTYDIYQAIMQHIKLHDTNNYDAIYKSL